MKKPLLLITALGLSLHALAKPNILFITVDDMNTDSLGIYGCPVPDTTPRLDALAAEGMRFEYAHVQVPNCSPSRNVLQTGRYPQNSGVEGFYDVDVDFPILPDLLQRAGYRTGIWGKVADTTPLSRYRWDKVMQSTGGPGSIKSVKEVKRLTSTFIADSQRAKKPFYFVVNISDPHHPLYSTAGAKKKSHDKFPPSRIYKASEIVVPGFLADIPKVREDVANYYSSVRRADDLIGAALDALEESGAADNTIVMFLSDHGMPFPFAKTNLYHHSTRTPWLVRAPGLTKPGSVDREHMISAIDFMPTILELSGITPPKGLDGRSFASLLRGESQGGREIVFKEFHENAGGMRNPMRAVETKRFGYIFNPWSDGKRVFKSATIYQPSYKAMQAAARNNPAIAARIKHFNHRAVEEFYDYEKDPDALNNLIDDPAYADEIATLRDALEAWMVEMNDVALPVFRNRYDVSARRAFLAEQQSASDARRAAGGPRKRK
jgi:N-sulfoglucosamine sulfohydrolase